jgi:uncharacterized protein YwqG
MKATGLTDDQVERFAAEGLLDFSWHDDPNVVNGADQFVQSVMARAGSNWPPPVPALDRESESRFALEPTIDLAASILEPFRFRSLAAVWDGIVALARPSARLLPNSDGASRIGMTRLGGEPDAGDDFGWPRTPERSGAEPLGFLGQVELAAVQSVCPSPLLPGSGTLLFFYDLRMPGGFDPANRGHWSVIHVDGELQRVQPPPDLPVDPERYPETGRFEEARMELRGELTLPPVDSTEIERLGLDRRGWRAYLALLTELDHVRGQIMNRCLGWPEPIQGDPVSETQLAFNGIYAGTGEAYQREESKRLLAERGAWRQLVQIDSEDAAGMMWGDGGRVHFMMRESDLVARAWNQAWLSIKDA